MAGSATATSSDSRDARAIGQDVAEVDLQDLSASHRTTRYGTATATSWDRVHPRLTRRACWLDHTGELPVIEGTLIRLQVQHLPGDRNPKPVWLWSSNTNASAHDVDRWWQAFLRRVALEHTFRLLKQTLGLDRSEDPHPAGGRLLDLAGDRRTHSSTAHFPGPGGPPAAEPGGELRDDLEVLGQGAYVKRGAMSRHGFSMISPAERRGRSQSS